MVLNQTPTNCPWGSSRSPRLCERIFRPWSFLPILRVLHGKTLWFFPLLQLLSVSLCLREMHKPFSRPFIAFIQGAEIAKEIQFLFLLFLLPLFLSFFAFLASWREAILVLALHSQIVLPTAVEYGDRIQSELEL